MTYPRVIGLNGVARAGKDTVANVLHQIYGYKVLSFSDALNKAIYTFDKEMGNDAAVLVYNVNGRAPERYSHLVDRVGYEKAKEIPGVRRALQVFGTEVGRRLLGDDIWVDALFKGIGPHEKVVITNVRFPNEAEAVWRRGGEVWEVTRPGFKPALGHISDTALDAVQKDEYIHNDGTIEELAQKVITLMDEGETVKADLQAAFNGGIREG